ncbi:hypothetical protein AgCh_031494 [Apium graveolens]
MFKEATTRHLNEYGEAGLRTLALAYKMIEAAEYSSWNEEFLRAKTSIGGDREAMLEHVSDMMEKDLILLGATAVEDKLQKGVPQCVDKLAQAGLKIWVLTGDKMETAINIGFACSLLRRGMKQICIAANADMLAQESKEVVKENILMQLTNSSQMVKLEKDPHAAFALIIDGKMLNYVLETDLKHQFLQLAVECASVICCRVSPKQKALVTRLVKQGTGKTTLAIGDGANDVGMIQEADIGVGISGVEGMQAVMASDFAIAQFRFLERLLVVHGHWCYKRIAQMAFRKGGETADLEAMGTTIDISGNVFKIFVEVLAPAPLYWITTLLVTVTCNLPYFALIYFQREFRPMDHQVIQEMKYYKKDEEDDIMWTEERSKARQETKIGFTARVDATIRQLKERLHKKAFDS